MFELARQHKTSPSKVSLTAQAPPADTRDTKPRNCVCGRPLGNRRINEDSGSPRRSRATRNCLAVRFTPLPRHQQSHHGNFGFGLTDLLLTRSTASGRTRSVSGIRA